MWGACGRIGLELMPSSGSTGDGGFNPNGDGSIGGDGGASCSHTGEVGKPDCADLCNGVDDDLYVPDESCGVGYCRTTNVPSRCIDGEEKECLKGPKLSETDATCDGIDDDCDGQVDEDYVDTAITCGFASCQRSGQRVCQDGALVDMCTPGTPPSTTDDTLDGVDDDCDGQIDQDVVCTPATLEYPVGTHTVKPGVCSTVTVRLWGAGGAAGDDGGYWGLMNIAKGGAGGYTERTFTVTKDSSIQLLIGRGGQGCSGAGTNDNAAYSGGGGGTTSGKAGTRGEDGSVTGGGGGTGGGAGGAGSFGGGGGGAGSRGIATYAPFGPGGGGGAASVAVVDGTRLIAGGGGGGGGMGSNFATTSFPGGFGGPGCSVKGANSGAGSGGGGGGGGVCQGGTSSQAGKDAAPHDTEALPAGTARGGEARCAAGGGGYAIVTLAP